MNMNNPYYHGSARQIHGDYLIPREQWNSVQNGRVNGAFVTSDENYAKFFAINGCIGKGQTKLDGKKIYLETLADKLKQYFYVYTVYETPDSAFIHDRGKEYYSETPIKIAEIQKYDTAAEINKLGYEVYVLDEPFKSRDSRIKNHTDNSVRQDYMNTAIRQGKYHRVDVAKIMRQQKKKFLERGASTIKNKANSLLTWLKNLANSRATRSSH